MSEPILNALVQLFALIIDINKDTDISAREKDVVRSFLARQLNNELVLKYMKLFEEYLALYNSERVDRDSRQDRKRTTLNAMKILAICEKINEELQQKQKIYVLVQLIDYISLGSEITGNEMDFLHSVAKSFYVDEAEYDSIRIFIMDSPGAVRESKNVLVIDDLRELWEEGIRHLYRENLRGSLSFLHIPSTNTYILRYNGNADLYLNGQNIRQLQTYVFDYGSSVRGAGMRPVYYSEIAGIISGLSVKSKAFLSADNITYTFRNSGNGIHNLSLHEESGRLVGILGGSGVGKSTTLSILNGSLKPQKGKVLINGLDLHDRNQRERLKGVIGFVPQDDLLIEELTVFQNLYYNAKLCLNNLEEEKIIEIVNKTLADFDLEETKDLKVGSPLKKVISGGQRKRVNIALELMREPTILFVDEPTSGLSSVDSEMVMNLLKAQAYKGRLVIVNIHQPGSDIYKMFDSIIIIDKGGYQVFYGNPTEAIIYFKRHSNHANAEEDQCVKCGNIDTDQVLQIIEAKVLDERGHPSRVRRVSPSEWAERLEESGMIRKMPEEEMRQPLPENNFSIPGLLKQSGIFFIRDLLSKLADRQYIMISLLGPPLLALLLAYFTRYAEGGIYTFSENENIPSYMFMCVITSFFFGLMVSSEEIVKDRKLLKRESFLNLSWFSYLNSKIMILFIISTVQTISFVLIGNLILGIRGMTAAYWLVLFTTSCTANILGLNLSSAFDSVITIYILIPFIIIPQLLFSGVLVKFDKLHIGSSVTREYVPLLGDMMNARWAFEAMAVKQFRDNAYERNFFGDNMEIARFGWYNNLVNNLDEELDWNMRNMDDPVYENEVASGFAMLKRYINNLAEASGLNPGPWIENLNTKSPDQETLRSAGSFLKALKSEVLKKRSTAAGRKEKTETSLRRSLGEESFIGLREKYENKKLVDMVQDILFDGKLVATLGEKKFPKSTPGYIEGSSPWGRSHFYAPYKYLGKTRIDTFSFNLCMVWTVTVLLYLALYYRLLYRVINRAGKLRIQKSET